MTPAVLQLANSVRQDRKTDLTNAQGINALKHASTRPKISGKNQLTYRNYLSDRFVRHHYKHGVALRYQSLFVQVNFKTLLTSFNWKHIVDVFSKKLEEAILNRIVFKNESSAR